MAAATRGNPDNTSWYKKVDPRLIWRKIHRVWVAVINDIKFEDHRDYLYQEGALNEDDEERVSAERTSRDKTIKLMRILQKKSKPPKALHTFLESLEENSEHVLKRIEEAEPVEEDSVDVDDEEITRFIERSLENDYEETEGESIPLDVLLKQLRKHAQRQKTSYAEAIGEDRVHAAMKQVYPEVKIEEWTQTRKGKKPQKKEECLVLGLSKRPMSARKPYEEETDEKRDGDSGDDESLLSDSDDSATKVKARMTHIDKHEGIKSTNDFADIGLAEWSIEDVGKWVEGLSFENETHTFGSKLRSIFEEERISGRFLAEFTYEHLGRMLTMPLGHKNTILSEINMLKNALMEQQMAKLTKAAATPRLTDVFRKFDSGAPSTMYKHNSYLPWKGRHSDNLLEPVHNFVEIENLDKYKPLRTFQTTTLRFATACLNDRTNGTIHFGVEEDESGGKIVGISVNQTKVSEALEKVLQNNIPPGDLDVVRNCVRPPKFVPVVGKDVGRSERFIVEIDVVASFLLCKHQDFYAREGTLHLYRFNDGVPAVQTAEQVGEFQKFKPDLANRRQNTESPQKVVIKQRSKPDLRRKLIHLLCQGETTLEGDLYPILVFTKANKDKQSIENVKKEFGFLKRFQWKAVFDFDNGEEGAASLYTFLEQEEEQLLKVFTVEDFDRSSTSNRRKPEAFQMVIDDMKNCNQRALIFTNGYEPIRHEEMGVVQWKRSRSEGFKECVRFLKNDIPQGRAVLVFMLLSKDFDVVLEAADELCTRFQDQWLVLAENEEIASLWKDGIMREHILEDRSDLDNNCVVGIPWEHVNETIVQLLGEQEEGACQIPTSKGTFINLHERVKNDLVDLEILSRNQYDEVEIVKDETKLSRHSAQTEEKFYKGGEVDWWNFWFQSHVYKRSCYNDLKHQVEDALSDMQEDKKVGRVYLYHQPGSGGTTSARHILWDLKDQYRCAVVRTITDQTCHQISTLHAYKDVDPKPVLLLLDNLDEEKISNLKAELEDKAKQISRHDRDNPEGVFYVFLVCRRGSKPPARTDGRQCVLKHELGPNELNWFRDKYQSLERDFHEKKEFRGLHPKHLISFNIMKENFSQEYIKKTVKEFVKDITDTRERTLLKYTSLLNAYDLNFQSVPSSAFDPIMKMRKRWELYLSQPLKVLLNLSSKTRDGHRIRIINNLLSKEILETLTCSKDVDQGQLGDIALEFLNSDIFLYNNSSSEYLEKVVGGIVKKRAKKPNGWCETKFAPLIQTIVDDQSQGVPKAAEVLIKVFEMTNDVFVAQQVARLYIHAQDWDNALAYAKLSTKEKSDSSFLWDTYGHVYKSQIVQKYNECIESGKHVSIEEARKVVDLAIVAVDIFQREQKISQEEKTKSITNNAGYFGEITVIVQLLDYLTYVDGLDMSELHQFLVDDLFVPVQLEGLGKETISKLRGLQNGAMLAMAQIEDEYLQLRDDMADDYRRTEAQKRIDFLIKLKENIENYYGEEDDEVPHHLTPEEECKYRRRRVFRLSGSTLRGMFEILKKPKGKAKETLKTIRRLVNDNLETPHFEASDIQSLLMVNIALCVMDGKNRDMIKHEDMAHQSKQLYDKRDELRGIHLEPYLFVLMLNWPRTDMTSQPPVLARKFSEIMKNWRLAFNRKYPRQREEGILRPYRRKETTMFFLGKEPEMKSFVHSKELGQPSSSRLRTDVWRTPAAHSRLARWRGMLLHEGSDIELTLTQNGVKTVLNIPTSFPIQHRRWWNKAVYFVIGFTWTGPKAYDIDIDLPEPSEQLKTEESSKSRATGLPRTSAQTINSTANPDLYLHTMFKKKLNGIKAKLRKIKQLKQERPTHIKEEEKQLLKREEALMQEEQLLIQNRQSTVEMFSLDI